ncbi:stalk domain-containing protein [Thermohalobacter berrensis]|uniref:SCP domain-containing protein n=1 Tax=Thermohalobacter berrensis TaxID=99594 RepID=A0A419T6F9_9FIRM|nr:stalk domain-containing protein [Thermohalobacter berrensis]RKD33150.1 hypothetical protein BET03_09530 [Thermohalobacter berrensis]
MRTKILLLMIFIVVFSNYAFSEDIWYYQPYPQGLIGVSKPTITWYFDKLGENSITSVDILIDGNKYKGVYNRKLKRISYIPEEELSPGKHNVTIIVTLDDSKKIKQSFEFEIDEDALRKIEKISEIEEIKNTLNKYRKILKLAPVRFNDSLNMAAKMHSNYMLANKDTGHYQYDKENPFYIGEEPLDRVKYYNYSSPVIDEEINFINSHQLAIIDWMNSIYHRLSLINPAFTEIGYGFSSNENSSIDVLVLGAPKFNSIEEKIITYPTDGQRNVPIKWDGKETPNPLREFEETETPMGYPITLLVSGKDIESVKINKALLKTNDKKVKSYILVPKLNKENLYNTPYLKEDEKLKKEIIIIPAKILEKNQKYSVEIAGKIIYKSGEEKDFSKKWGFTTGNGEFRFDYQENKEELNIYFNNMEVFLNNSPFITEGVTMVPLREYCEFLGIKVSWNGKEKSITLKGFDKELFLKINSNKVLVDNISKEMRKSVILKEDKSYAPLRFISEAFGLNVKWDGEYKDIFIRSKKNN